MNQTQTDLPALYPIDVALRGKSPDVQPHRLVVVIRGVEEQASLAARILELAKPSALPIVLIGVARDGTRAAELRRTLITIAAFLRDGRSQLGFNTREVPAPSRIEIEVEQGAQWLGRLAGLVSPQDMLACADLQPSSVRQRPLNDILSASLKMPVYTFTSLAADQPVRHTLGMQAAAWITSIASIAGFFALQARIVFIAQGWAQSVLLLITLFAEAGLLLFLNSTFA